MRKLFIGILAVALVVGMSMGVMAEDSFESEAEIEQLGNNNLVESYQMDVSDKPNIVDVIQEGNLNEAFIDQGFHTGTIVSQFGNRNYVDVDVDFNQYTEIEQDGNDNNAVVTTDGQGDSGWYNNEDNKGTQLVQRGDNNEFSATNFISSSFSKQIGDDNYIDLNQASFEENGMFKEAYLTQDGDSNFIELTQKSGNGPSEADIAALLQRGNNNVARLEQSGISEFSSEDKVSTEFYKQDSEATFAQLGNRNRLAGVAKNGDEIVLTPYENAEQNSSVFMGYQDGNDNEIGLYQGGNDFANITQDGDDNEALLYQGKEVGHSTDITQDGDENTAEVIQTSSSN